MVLMDDRSKGVRLQLESRGRSAMFLLELRNASRDDRQSAAVSLTVFAEVLAARLTRNAGAVKT